MNGPDDMKQDDGRRRPSKGLKAFAIASVAIGALSAMSAAGSAAPRDGVVADVMGETLGAWVHVGTLVDLARGALLAGTGIGLLQLAAWARRLGVLYGLMTIARALVGVILVESSVRPHLLRMSMQGREQSLQAAYVEGHLFMAMIVGVCGVALALAAIAVVTRATLGVGTES